MASRSTRRQRFDVICVGDVATDVFITLSPDQVEVRGEAGEPTLVIPFGAKLPYESVATVPAGGNAANAAVACARLGLHVALAAFVGADQLGRDAVAALNAEGVDRKATTVPCRVLSASFRFMSKRPLPASSRLKASVKKNGTCAS